MHRWLGVGLIALGSCAQSTPSSESARDPALDQRLLAIAGEYLKYGRVDDMNRWSPELCRLSPSQARHSASDDEATHGRKIYFLFARDREAYVAGIKEPQPEGQAIVKEAWEPVPAKDAEIDLHRLPADEGGHYVPTAKKDGRAYTLGPKSGLFIMLKEAGGWRYGTVSADGARVLQSGAIRSCIGCHRDARPDSLFGLPGQPSDR